MNANFWKKFIIMLENSFVPRLFYTKSWFPMLNENESFDTLLPDNETLFSCWEIYKKPSYWVKKQEKKLLYYQG